jgi:RHS repeat-associated protein
MISRVALPNNGQTYRFGFNGKENDNGVKGLGNQQDYGMRFYDPRVGRFLSTDPLTTTYPWYTPYQFAGNTPTRFIDLDGAERKDITEKYWPYSIDMAQCPSTYKGVSGKVVNTDYVLHGYGRNYLYFWEQMIKQHPEFLDEWNKGRVLTMGSAPIFTYQLKAHWEELGIATEGLKVSDIIEHHHENQGRIAVPITSKEHDQIPHEKNTGLNVTIPSKPGRITKMLNKSLKATNALSYGADVLGLLTGDPASTANQFGKQSETGVVYRNLESNLFYTIVSKVDEGNGVTAYFLIFADVIYDKQQKKWVGKGEVGHGESYQEKGGYVRNIIYDNEGKVVGANEKGITQQQQSRDPQPGKAY